LLRKQSVEQQHASNREGQEVDVGVKPLHGVGIFPALVLIRAVVEPVRVVTLANALQLPLQHGPPQV
jgi:hypothetical protein